MDDFTDEETLAKEEISSQSKNNKYALEDEDTNEDDFKKKESDDGVWVNINDLHHGYPEDWATRKNFIDDEAEEDLQQTDMGSENSGSDDGHDTDSFIDDESLGYYSTDDDDDFWYKIIRFKSFLFVSHE